MLLTRNKIQQFWITLILGLLDRYSFIRSMYCHKQKPVALNLP